MDTANSCKIHPRPYPTAAEEESHDVAANETTPIARLEDVMATAMVHLLLLSESDDE
jgi:hypothetical protein